MNIARAAAAASVTAGLILTMSACSFGGSVNAETASPDATSESTPEQTATEEAEPNEGATAELSASCEEFNTIMADLRLIESGDSDAYDEIYLRAQAARDMAPVETYDLFSAVGLLALDSSLGDKSEETADMLRDAAFASAGPCTEAGVTLTLSAGRVSAEGSCASVASLLPASGAGRVTLTL